MVKTILPPMVQEEEEKKFVLPPIESGVLEGSVLNKFDDDGNKIKVSVVDKIKNLFKKKKTTLPSLDIVEIEDPILKSIAEIEKEYYYENWWGHYKEQVLKRTHLGTVRDTGQATIDFSNYLLKKFPGIDKNVIDFKLPEIKEPNYFGGGLIRDVSGFVSGYGAVTKAGNVIPIVKNIPKAKGKINKAFRIIAKGGLAEQFTFSPYEKRLSNLVETYKDEKFSNSVTKYLQAVDTDSENEARAKMFAEGAILAIPLEVMFWSIGKAYSKVKGKKADTEIDVEVKAKQGDNQKFDDDIEKLRKDSNLSIDKLNKEIEKIRLKQEGGEPKINTSDDTINIETKDIKPIKYLVENDIIKLKDNKPKIDKLKKELDDLQEVELTFVEKPLKVSENITRLKKNNIGQIKLLNQQIKILEKKQFKVEKNPQSVSTKEYIVLPERIKTLKEKVAKLELENQNIKTEKVYPDVKKTEAHVAKIEKVINQLRPLEVEQKIYESTRVKTDLTAIAELRKELKEARAIKVERKVEVFDAGEGKIKKVITTDNVIATQKKNTISQIQAKIKKLEKNEKIENAQQATKDQADIDGKIGSKPRTLEGLDIPEGVSVKGLDTATLKRINSAAEELLTGGKVIRNPNIKLYEQISDLLYTGRLTNDFIEAVLKKHNITLREFAQFFGATNAQAGRTLQMLSQIQKRLNTISKTASKADEKAFLKALDESNNGGFFSGILSVGRRLDNIRRALMVSQIATAVRNLESQTFKQGISVLQETVEKAIQVVFKSIYPKAVIKRVASPLNTLGGFARIFRQFDPWAANKIKKEVDLILSSFPKEGDALFLRFSSDVSNMSGKKFSFSPLRGFEKVADLLNIFNKAQEFITRRAVFQARLNNLILNAPEHYSNRTLKEIIEQGDTKIIRKQDAIDSVAEALDSTFAKNFSKFDGIYDSVAYKFIQIVNAVPFTFSLIIPFPRFLMNSLKFHIDFSPIGLLPMFSKKQLKKMAEGDFSQISKVAIGTSMLGVAYAMRKQEYAGEKWYEFKFGDRYIDVRPFNPFVAYLYVADLMIRLDEGRLRDLDLKGIASVFAGSRAGTGLYLIDKLIDITTGNKPVKSGEKLTIIKSVVGNILSTYLTPMQTALDFMAENDPELAIVRDSRKDPLWGQSKKKISPTELEPIYSSTSIEYTKDGTPVAKRIVRESPGYRQLTGMSIIPVKNEAEKMLDKNGFLPQEVFRSTGIPELDKAYKMLLAPKIALELSTVVSLPFFKRLDVNTQNYVIKEQLTKYKEDVMESLQKDSTIMAYVLQYKISKIPKDKRKVIDDMLGKNFLFDLVKEFQTDTKNKTVLPPLN